MRRRILVIFLLSVLLVQSISGCSSSEVSTELESYSFPDIRPVMTMPDIPELAGRFTILENQRIGYTENLENYRFVDCEVSIKGENITLRNCEFINSIIYV